MRIYETTFIVNPQVEEATIDRQVKAVAEVITQNGGKILQENHLGTRRLAYEIKGLTQGFYGGFIFESGNETLPPLERHYKLTEAYLRHLTVRFEGELTGRQHEVTPELIAAVAPEPTIVSEEPKTRVEPVVIKPAPKAEVTEPEAEVEMHPEPPTESTPEPEPDESAPEDAEEML